MYMPMGGALILRVESVFWLLKLLGLVHICLQYAFGRPQRRENFQHQYLCLFIVDQIR